MWYSEILTLADVKTALSVMLRKIKIFVLFWLNENILKVYVLYFWLDPKVPIPRPRDKADEGMSAKATRGIIHAIRAVHI